jgi:YfiH family protein
MARALFSSLVAGAGFRHAFFTRQGGVSQPPFASLSFSVSVGDTPEAVAENLRRASEVLELRRDRIFFLSQVHGRERHWLDGEQTPEQVLGLRGDITLSSSPEIGCAVRTADCPAVLIADRRRRVVAAVHSGWRGTVLRAVESAVAELRASGAEDLIAAVGPCIERCCFEVGADVAAELAAASSLGERAVLRDPPPETTKQRTTGSGLYVDLRAILAAQLSDAGVTEVDQVEGCTMCDAELFHSYRRDGPKSGRMLAAIVGGSAA